MGFWGFGEGDLAEDLSKVFEKMVYQLEMITSTFQNFDNRLSRIEECLTEMK